MCVGFGGTFNYVEVSSFSLPFERSLHGVQDLQALRNIMKWLSTHSLSFVIYFTLSKLWWAKQNPRWAWT